MTSRLEFIDDPSLPDGFVVISITPPIADGSDARLSVTRKNADRPSLGPHGWQAAEHKFTPLQVRQLDVQTQLVFGPDLSAHVAVDSDVTVSLPGQAIRERHFWPEIAAGADASTLYIDLPEQRQRVNPQQRGLPAGSRVGAIGTPDGEGGNDSLRDPEPEERNSDVKTGGDPITENDIQREAHPWLKRAAIAAVLLLLGSAATMLYLFIPDPDGVQEQATTAPDPTVSAPQETEAAPLPAAVTETAPTTSVTPSLADRYRSFLGQQGHADDLLALGREALIADETEVGFNAVTLSADRGSADAKFLIGQWYDPGQTDSPTRPNANNAANYYREAASLNHPEAMAALQELCSAAQGEGEGAPDWASDFDMKTNCQ